ncbi:MAG: N-6 DNA methylase, partial [Bacteroidales bacterium]|nr:N-6 DNA methylase [Bacteroidales bacterium]
DRSNAFNRIISLILAKIVDESKGNNEVAGFQIKPGVESHEEVLERLQSLYSKAMKDYLQEDVIDYTIGDIEREINNFPKQSAQENLLRIYRELKFYSNNEFAFKEIYNEKLFNENAKVLEEIIRLFQPYKFKYNKKAQFLGDFFELMLETGYKQSEGQFFTPTPIARYIISSIPLNEIIHRKIGNKEKRFLPTVIDFACGSGHFLTEAIEEIQELIQNIDPIYEKEYDVLKHYRNNTIWAGDYIYGVEKDYRLARTTQVACFMHGDGEANIIFGDGLEKHERLQKDGTYDVLIANPPYTIKDFKKHLNVNPQDYELWENLTIDSDDIEVLFIERMKQLLTIGGMAGIILPSSILSNAGVYTKAREIILKHFEIIAITEFGGITFGATSTNTVTLFLKKRHNDFVKNCGYIADDFILNQNGREHDFINSEQLFKNYVSLLNLDFKAYKSFVNREANEEIKETEFYKNYNNWFEGLTVVKKHKKKKTFNDLSKDEKEAQLKSMFYDFVLEIERDKFFNFLLTHKLKNKQINEKQTKKSFVPQKILIVKSGSDNATQKAFLGYSFSDRRGYKGINVKPSNKMYDNKNLINPAKVNSYIYKAFLNQPIPEIHEELTKHLKQVNLVDCINFEKIDFDKRINTSPEIKREFASKYSLIDLERIANIDSGTNAPQDLKYFTDGKYAFIRANNLNYLDDQSYIIPLTENLINDLAVKELTLKEFPKETILFPKSGQSVNTNNIGRLKEKSFVVNHLASVFCKNLMLNKILFYILKTFGISNFKNVESGYPTINLSTVKKYRVPDIPENIQQKITIEIEAIENKEEKAKNDIEGNYNEVKNIINKSFTDYALDLRISNSFYINNNSIDPKKEYGDNLFTYVDIDSVGKGTGKIEFTQKIKGIDAPSRAKRIAENETVIISTVRPYLKGFAFIEKVPEQTIFSTGFALIKSENEKDYSTKLLYYYFMFSDNLMEQMKVKMPKSSYPSINKADIDSFTIPNIPFQEQIKLLKELKKLETKIEKLEQSISNTETEKKEILKKYLEE